MELFYFLPEQGKLFKYDNLTINVIVKNRKGGINSCDIPFYGDMKKFIEGYNMLTSEASDVCKSSFLEDCMVVGTSV